jgi:hypothetical protein
MRFTLLFDERSNQREAAMANCTTKTTASQASDSARMTGRTAPAFVLLTPKEAASLLKVSLSWLAKARMRGDGPPYMEIGRSIRYPYDDLIRWMKGRQRLSTSERYRESRGLPGRTGLR